MNITIVSKAIETVPTAKGSYQKAIVTYKNEQGKNETKNILSFANKEVWNVVAEAQPGDKFVAKSEKNKNGYWEWIALTRGSAAPATNPGVPALANAVPQRGNWETPDERAKKQVYIVRQSSISAAIATLSVGAKTAPSSEAILKLAREYEDFVFGNDDGAYDVAVKTADNFLDDPLPF